MSQLRQHLKFRTIHKIRAWRWRKKLAKLGTGVWIDKNVDFQRFPANIEIDKDVVVKEGARLCACNSRALISIGARTTVGYHTFVYASEKISIGDDCLIAPFVYMVDSNHGTVKSRKINEQANSTAAINIGNDVWIGNGVTVLMGVTIANGAVIAANSVVNEDVGPYEIWAGSPAKKVSERK